MIPKPILYISVLLFSILGVAQVKDVKSYALNQCIAIALENNLDLKSTNLTATTERINYRQSKTNLLPSLNGNYNIGVNNGRSIDPFTNDYNF